MCHNLSISNFNYMKKFVLKVTIFSCGTILLLQILGIILDNFQIKDSHAKSLALLQVKQLLQSSPKTEVLALGNSHTKSIDLDTLGYNGYYLWQSSQDIFEVKHKILIFIPRLADVKTVLIAISYFSFNQDNQVLPDHRDIRKNLYASDISLKDFHLSDIQILDGDFGLFSKMILSEFIPLDKIMNADNWVLLSKSIVSETPNRQIITNENITTLRKDGNVVTENYTNCKYMAAKELVKDTRTVTIPRHLQMQTQMTLRHLHLQLDVYNALAQIIEYLQQRNIRVVFYTPPYSEIYTRLYDPETIKFMKASMLNLQAIYDIEYYNFSTDDEFIYDHRLFANGDHMNLCGARLFSSKFKQILAAHKFLLTP